MDRQPADTAAAPFESPRARLGALPAHELAAAADTAIRDAAARHGWPAVRAEWLPRQLQIEWAIVGALRAAAAAAPG